jgi:hypothetical protein
MEFYNSGENGYGMLPVYRTTPNDLASNSNLTSVLNLASNTLSKTGFDIFDANKIGRAKRILVIEEDTRLQRILQKLIQEENAEATCVFRDSLDEFLQLHKDVKFDLVIANYYQAEDEVDYDFWDEVRTEFPEIDIVIHSHINDREYYEMLEKIHEVQPLTSQVGPTAKLKTFFEHIFGGRNGNQ